MNETVVYDLNEKIVRLQKDYQKLLTRHEMLLRTQVSNINNPGSDDIRKLLKEINNLTITVEQIKNENELLKADLESKCSYIESVTRVIREKSCPVRGIPNKKKATGYVVTGLSQQIERSSGDYCQEEYACWKLVLQTYYDYRYRISDVFDELIADIQVNLFPLLYMTEVKDCRNSNIENIVRMAAENPPYVILYRAKAMLDVKNGFWQVELYLTSEPFIPEEILQKPKSEKKD